MISTSRYLRIPFVNCGRGPSGVDCWGLVELFLFEQFGIKVPSMQGEYNDAADAVTVESLFENERSNWRIVEAPQPGDVIAFRLEGKWWHFGVSLGGTRFIHSMKGVGTAVEDYSRVKWARRVKHFYRHGSR